MAVGRFGGRRGPPHEGSPKTALFWFLPGLGFHTNEPEFIRIVGNNGLRNEGGRDAWISRASAEDTELGYTIALFHVPDEVWAEREAAWGRS
jgi:hypothetical protein